MQALTRKPEISAKFTALERVLVRQRLWFSRGRGDVAVGDVAARPDEHLKMARRILRAVSSLRGSVLLLLLLLPVQKLLSLGFAQKFFTHSATIWALGCARSTHAVHAPMSSIPCYIGVVSDRVWAITHGDGCVPSAARPASCHLLPGVGHQCDAR
jgi:hypothetical protein